MCNRNLDNYCYSRRTSRTEILKLIEKFVAENKTFNILLSVVLTVNMTLNNMQAVSVLYQNCASLETGF